MYGTIVNRIEELRKSKGWSKYALAQNTGISINTIYSWYNSSVTSLSNIVKICNAMDITLEQFFCIGGSFNKSDEENSLLTEWFCLSDLERKAIFSMIDVFKTLKLI